MLNLQNCHIMEPAIFWIQIVIPIIHKSPIKSTKLCTKKPHSPLKKSHKKPIEIENWKTFTFRSIEFWIGKLYIFSFNVNLRHVDFPNIMYNLLEIFWNFFNFPFLFRLLFKYCFFPRQSPISIQKLTFPYLFPKLSETFFVSRRMKKSIVQFSIFPKRDKKKLPQRQNL